MSAKTAYEIRLELLQLAEKICWDKHNASNNVANTNGTNMFTSPTTQEILKTAEELNVFLCKK